MLHYKLYMEQSHTLRLTSNFNTTSFCYYSINITINTYGKIFYCNYL